MKTGQKRALDLCEQMVSGRCGHLARDGVAGSHRGLGDSQGADFFINSSSPVSPFADSIPVRHREHAAIVAAIGTVDAGAARTAAAAHILETVALIERTIERSNAPAVT
jgi:hypothetical protein